MKKRLAGAFLALVMVLSLLPVSALAADEKGSSADNPFTTVAEYNDAVSNSDWDGKDIHLTITGGTFDSSNLFNLTNVQSRANPPKLHLTITGATFTGNTANDSTNPSFMYLSNCQELVIDNCIFNAGESGLKYGINWNLIQITGATVSITGCTFNGAYTENAIKLNQRGGEDDKATDVKPTDGEQTAASIAEATISGCTFAEPTKAIILLGSAGKNDGNAASPSTGAFPVTITADNSGANVFLAYLASESEAEAAMGSDQSAIAKLVVPLGAGDTAVKTANGDFAKEEDFVAEVNGDKYTTFQAALDAAKDNDTVTVLDDIDLTSVATISGTNITLDLGSNTVKSVNSAVLVVEENSSVTISNGTLFSSNTSWTPTLSTEKNVTLTIASDATVVGPYGLGLNDHTSTGGSNVTIHVYGTVRGVNASDNTNLLQYGGTVGIGINGMINSTADHATIHIYDGAVVSGSHGNSGSLNSDDGPAIYAAGYADWIIDDGATISGDEALSIKSGNFTINGGTFTATGTYADPATSWGNGTEATGAAISITNNNGYAKNVEMTISGGIFTSENGYAIYENDTQTQAGSALGPDGLSITDGTFTGAESVGSVSSANGGQFISGGTFSGTVDSFVVAGMEQDENGRIVIDTNTAVASVNGVGHTSLADAITAAGSDGTVVLVADTLELDQAIPAGVTLEVPSGKTLTVATNNFAQLFTSQGKVQVKAGGAIEVGGVKMIGGNDANINLKSGAIELQVDNNALSMNFVGASAEIPSGNRWTLLLGGTYHMNPTLDSGSTLTVISTGETGGEADGFRVANGSTLTNNGNIIVTGVMTVSSDGTVTGTGSIQVSGVLVNNQATANVNNNITLASGGKVYSQSDISDKITNKTNLSDKDYNNVTYANAWAYYVASSGGGSSTPTYSSTVESSANGSVSLSPKNASKGATVTITVTPDEGYMLDTLTVTDKDGKAVEVTKTSEGKYTFKMPGSAVTVKATFAQKPDESTMPFTDVAESAWYYDAVVYVYANGMMTGTNDGTTFSPFMNLTRGMMAQVLYNIEKGTAPTTGSFTDVAAGAWYADAVNWAASKGIVGGYGNGTFGPEDSITREQMAVLLYNYASFKGNDMTASADLSVFADGDQVSDWAEYAMNWAVAEGLIQGSNSSLNPQGTASRAEVAQILMNYFGK